MWQKAIQRLHEQTHTQSRKIRFIQSGTVQWLEILFHLVPYITRDFWISQRKLPELGGNGLLQKACHPICNLTRAVHDNCLFPSTGARLDIHNMPTGSTRFFSLRHTKGLTPLVCNSRSEIHRTAASCVIFESLVTMDTPSEISIDIWEIHFEPAPTCSFHKPHH